MKASVIIPAFNAQKTIQKCLESLQQQNLPRKDYEILVVDDGSTDQTARIVSQFEGVLLLRQKNKGPAVARNQGANHARGDLLVFLDADCVPKKNWLEKMLEPFEDSQVAGVQGRYENSLDSWVARFIQFEIEERYERLKKGMATHKKIDFVSTYSAAYCKTVFLEQGGFDEGYRTASGEDTDLSFSLAEKGYRLVFAPAAVVQHFHPTSLVKYFKTKFYRAYWRVRLYKQHPEKVKKDSYTNPWIKIQMAAITFSLASLVIYIIGKFFGWGVFSFYWLFFFVYWLIITVLVQLFLSIPTAFFIFKKDWKLGIAAPFIFSANAFLFIIGYFFGLLKLGGQK
ncbi:glycosyltransferase [Candidatus Micrarchaeota archaeon]|nr:glycosyltransferase [Candidatus Micrarchaeota archaeon]